MTKLAQRILEILPYVELVPVDSKMGGVGFKASDDEFGLAYITASKSILFYFSCPAFRDDVWMDVFGQQGDRWDDGLLGSYYAEFDWDIFFPDDNDHPGEGWKYPRCNDRLMQDIAALKRLNKALFGGRKSYNVKPAVPFIGNLSMVQNIVEMKSWKDLIFSF